jgi:hypothetical protein
MGYNPGLLDLFAEWGLKSGDAVLDIGTSELFCADDPGSLNRFLQHIGAEPYVDGELDRVANRAFAAELFERAGLVYRAIDVTAYPNTLKIDLNTGRLPFWQRGRYDLVTNCGTTEHVLNQLNAFRLIHDACKVGGLMYHGVPMCGEFDHGFISYHPRFFMRLAEANAYKVVKIWAWVEDGGRADSDVAKVEVNRPIVAHDSFVQVLFRKTWRGAFRPPDDCIGYPPPTPTPTLRKRIASRSKSE